MPEHIQYEDDDLFNPETHHEESDVPLRPLWWSLILFVVFAAIMHVVLFFFYKALVKGEQKRMDPPQTAVTRPADAAVPKNQPLLQPFPLVPGTDTTATEAVPYQNTPVTDLLAMRANEEKVLKNYGWVDQSHGVVRIPIQQAKELMAARIAVQGQLGASGSAGVPPAGPAASSPPPPGAVTSPAGVPIPPDTGIAPGGTHQ
jgi:hypothetical protein